MYRIITIIVSLFLLCNMSNAADLPLSVSTSCDKVVIKTGELATLTIVLKNPNAPQKPIPIIATATWVDAYGVAGQTVSSTLNLTVNKPIKVNTVKIPMTIDKISYVTDSAKLDGQSIPVILADNYLTLTIDKEMYAWTQLTGIIDIVGL